MQRDVDEGRAALNFSEWNRQQEEAGDAAEEVREGEMPLRIYTWLHTHSRLSNAERERLARGLERTLGFRDDNHDDHDGHDDHDDHDD